MNKSIMAALMSIMLLGGSASAQVKKQAPLPAEMEIPLKYGADRLGKRQDADMKRFRDNRLGAFIHRASMQSPAANGTARSTAVPPNGSNRGPKCPPMSGSALWISGIPPLSTPKPWARMAKQMGVKYVKITTKHHEGFCLWPSKYTKYTVANTPYKKDILGEMVKAFNDEGIDVHFYFSVMDRSHPDYRYDIKSKEDEEAFDRFL